MARISGATGTVSWIDPASPAGSGIGGVADPKPADSISEAFITGNTGFRFSNYVKAWIETADGRTVKSDDFEAVTGIYRAPSFGSIASEAYPLQRSKARKTRADGVEYVEFEQTAGARTRSHESFGTVIGGVAGAGVGAFAGGKIGAKIGAIGGPKGIAIGFVIGLIAGAVIGNLAAKKLFNFPPIWSTVLLRLHADERIECELKARSSFPSCYFYCDRGATGTLGVMSKYDALEPEQRSWQANGWDAGNPWNAARP